MKHLLLAIALPTIFTSMPLPLQAQTSQPQKLNALMLVNQFVAQQKAAQATKPEPRPETIMAPLPASATADEFANGPFITRVERVESGVPVFKKIRHSAPAVNQKVVMIALPRSTKGQFSVEKFQVSITFSVLRDSDSCNQTIIQGGVTEVPVPGATYLTSYRMEIKPGTTATTLMACDDPRRTSKQVVVTTELESPRAFRDNLVFYVPKDVTVKAKIWKAATTVEAKSPEETEALEDFGPSELNN